MPEPKPFYRLEEYMLEKYGPNYENWFWQVAQFVQFEIKSKTSVEVVRSWCNDGKPDLNGMTHKDVNALKKLFGIKNNEDFFTNPVQIPEQFKEQIHN